MNDILALIQLIAIVCAAGFQIAAFANRTEAGLEMGAGWRSFFAVSQNYTPKGQIYWWLSGLCFTIVAAISVYSLVS